MDLDPQAVSIELWARRLTTLGRSELLPWFKQIAFEDLEYFISFCKGGQVSGSSEDAFLGEPVALFPRELPNFIPSRLHKIVVV